MRSIKIIAILVSFFFLLNAQAQKRNKKVLLKIDHEKIRLDEFLNAYHKSNNNLAAATTTSIEDYLDLYINFRLKVKDAKDLKIDTISSLKDELEGYKKQLAKPYFFDQTTNDLLVKEAYERLLIDVRASHLLVNCPADANPSDTLKAYEKIIAFKAQIQKGEDFQHIATQFSDDLSARNQTDNQNNIIRKGNGGDLGFFTVFDMVYSFENAAYGLPIGSISDPIRTRFGYHLIKITDRHQAIGEIELAQIFLRDHYANRTKKEAEKKIFEIYSKLKSGEDFEKMVMDYSEDQSSKSKNGLLPSFKANDLIPEFYLAIFDIENMGAFSKPIKTSLGWHIIKLIEHKKPKAFEDEKSVLEGKVKKDLRSELSKKAKLSQIKKDYRIKAFTRAKEILFSSMDSTLLKGNWNIEKAKDLNLKLIGIGENIFTQTDFTNYIYKNQQAQNDLTLSSYYEYLYEGFVSSAYETSFYNDLEKKDSEFKSIMNEYRDGLLLFELTERKVWKKSMNDINGLMSYYQNNKGNYGENDFNNIKGVVISDYQNHLEKVWIEELKSKYSIVINNKVLSQIL